MKTPEDISTADGTEKNKQPNESRKKQQQSDPQITELKGFFDKNEKLEPELEDDKPKDGDKGNG